MNRILYLIFLSLPIYCFGQIENRWQPDSLYANRQVKKIFVYMNSPKDLSEVVEFDRTGKRIRLTKYNASYNHRTRKSKTIEKVNRFEYDTQHRLIKIIDSSEEDSITYKYGTNGKLTSSQKNLGSFVYETTYSYQPYKSITTRRNDSIILYQKTHEYDKDFYVKRSYGFNLEPKLKRVKDSINSKTTAYRDYRDLEKFKDDKTITNTFNEVGQIIKSDIHLLFRNDRVTEYQLKYEYYKNGLFKSIRGYVPRYFEYEYWE